MKTVAIKNMACCHTGMRYDFHKYFELNGVQVIEDFELADYIVVISCASVKSRETTCVNYIKNVVKMRKKKTSKIIVAGCLPKISQESLKQNEEVININKCGCLDEVFSARVPLSSIGNYNLFSQAYPDLDLAIYNNLYVTHGVGGSYPSGNKGKDLLTRMIIIMLRNFVMLKSHRNYKSYYIFPNFGCAGNCSFCAIKFAIGSVKSSAVNEVMEEVYKGISLGFNYFKIFSSDLGNYGVDINTNCFNLLDSLTDIKGDYQLELNYINPQWIVGHIDEFLKILEKRKIREIYLPIQSGSQRILDMMLRRYKIDDVKRCLRLINSKHPYLKIITAVIIGFPSESEGDFAETLDLFKRFNFSQINVLPYSDRPGTLSASFLGKVPSDIIRRRHEILKKELRTHMFKVRISDILFDLTFDFGQGWKRK